MAAFVLVHGAFHGAWCWHKIVSRLESRGHSVVALDLPGHGQVSAGPQFPTADDYFSHVAGVVENCGEPVVLVGHSMGGMVITGAAERAPDHISRLVYLTAFLIPSGESMQTNGAVNSLVATHIVPDADGRAVTFKPEGLRETFYNDCAEDDVALAKRRIVPQSFAPITTPVVWSPDRYGRLPRSYIECTLDMAISIADQRRMVARMPCDDVVTLESGHSPFFSAPDQLTDVLARMA
jgi:pimeloyl-ACP methyl ester carboxylesterase